MTIADEWHGDMHFTLEKHGKSYIMYWDGRAHGFSANDDLEAIRIFRRIAEHRAR